MARDTVDKAVEVGGLNDPRGCQTDGLILDGGEGWYSTLFIRLVQDYGLEVEVHVYNTIQSIKGPSEKGTTSLQRTLPISPKYICNIFSKKRTASLQLRDRMAGSKVSLARRFQYTYHIGRIFQWIYNSQISVYLHVFRFH